ncbi:MAG TPA: hypothetical protein EYG80_00995 [Flavobacteriaceae bacterium]|nr:hypothetical protein [Flavobacteriaceae bacterium]
MKNPFPIEKLSRLEFGSVDGFRDEELEDTFVRTTFIDRFLQDKHSIITGPIGSGKSALFTLLKNRSDKIGIFKDRTVISIDELIPFSKIKSFSSSLNNIDERQLYQFIWKFHITQKITEYLSTLSNFPRNNEEKEINEFLKSINSKEYNEAVIDKLLGLINHSQIRFKTKISNTPIDIEASLNKKNKKKEKINLDKVLSNCIYIIQQRRMNNLLIIIDKIDTFVAGEEYDTQRKYIEALLEVDDDMFISYPEIGRKIFLRKDLYSRLNFEYLGRDKVDDNTLPISWTQVELILFLGSRIKNALIKEKLLTKKDLEEKTKHSFIYRIFFFYKKEDKSVSQKQEYMQNIITKVFPHVVKHKNEKCQEEKIDVFDFFTTHFFNSQKEVSPRNLLIFLKKVNDFAVTYYDENRDKKAEVLSIKNRTEWRLYRHDFIYKAYVESKKDFIRNIASADNKWKKHFSIFLKNIGKRQTFDLKWIKKQIEEDDIESAIFCAYLESVGFLCIREEHVDIKKRKYELPIMYIPRCT